MAKLELGANPTSVILRVKLLDSSVATGAGLTGLAYNTAGLIISTIQPGEATPTVYTVTAGNVETIATLGTYAAPTASKCRFKEVDATNHPGVYEIQLADARFASTGSLIVSVSGATDLAECDIEIGCKDLEVNLTSLNNLSSADVNAACDTALSDYDPPTKTELDSLQTHGDSTWATADVSSLAPAGEYDTEMGRVDVAVSTRSSHTAANVWEVGTRTLTSFGTLVADTASAVWGAVSRTLTAFSFTPSLDSAYDAAKTAAQAGEAATALTDYDPPTKTEMDSSIVALRDHGDGIWATADLSGVALTGEYDGDFNSAGLALAAIQAKTDNLKDSWNDLSAAEVNAEVDTALVDYDGPTKTEMDNAFAALNDITVAEIIAGIADGDYDLQEMLRIMFAALAGKSTGGGSTTLTFRDSADSKARVTVTVDSNGNRTATTLDGS